MDFTKALLAATFASTLIAPTITTAAQELVMVDGKGTTMGPVTLDPDDAAFYSVTYTVGDMPVKLLFSDNNPSDTSTRVPLFYESADCSGTAMLGLSADKTAPRDAVIFATSVYWPQGMGRDLTVKSAGWMTRDGQECSAVAINKNFCCAPLPKPESLRGAPAAGVDLTSLHLTSPFRVEPAR